MVDLETQIEKLSAAIAGLESQRKSLGNAVVDPAIAALREQLKQLESTSGDRVETDERKLVTIVFADVSGFTKGSTKFLAFLESQLASAPNGGGYLCGDRLTAADIIMSYPLFAARDRFDGMGTWEGGSAKAAHPKLFAYAEKLEAEAGYKKSAEKIREIEGKFQSNL